MNIGSNVALVISLGQPQVPNVVGSTQAAATTAITSIDSLTVSTTSAYSNTVAVGLVISQNPVGGTFVNIGSNVALVISLGQPQVPNVVGSTQAAATTAITSIDSLTVSTTSAYSDTVAVGLVISQNPVGGTFVNIGSNVALVISLGQPQVPNVVGSTQAAATTAITSIDSLTVSSTSAYSDTVAVGLVISQNPVGGTFVNIGSNVALVISLGQPQVPNVVGSTLAAATTAITSVDNLTVSSTTAYSDTVAAGLVISQNPVGGTFVNIGSNVALVVSLGQPQVPNVVGSTLAAATTAITSVDNLTVSSTSAYSNTVAVGLVISQNPVGGTFVNIGSNVALVVSLGQPQVPNVVGSTLAAATTAITSVDNLTVSSTSAYSDTVAVGLVISQNPVGGTFVNIGSNVALVISLGPAPGEVHYFGYSNGWRHWPCRCSDERSARRPRHGCQRLLYGHSRFRLQRRSCAGKGTATPLTRTAGSYTNVVADQTDQNYMLALPADDFNDSKKGRMWRYGACGRSCKVVAV